MPAELPPSVPESAGYQRGTFADLPGWAADNHVAALATFRLSCGPLLLAAGNATKPPAASDRALVNVCRLASALPANLDASRARAFFEQNFAPHRVLGDTGPGLLTAYYEPVIAGARIASPTYSVPLHRRPSDLVNLVDEADRGAKAGNLTHARGANGKHLPYATRQDIDNGALARQGLEVFYVTDEVERFFLQVQGSGIIRLPDGQQVRVGYDGKNGHPYTSIGRHLIDTGVMTADQMSLQALATWLRADPARGRAAMWQNKSYVFFREMPGATAPVGVMGVGLTAHRSMAIDPAFHALGLPIFVDAPEITHITGAPFRQTMVGQDVGSAIRGRQRGDIYAGSGPEAGKVAGITKHPGRFFVLLPIAVAGAAVKP